MSWLFSQALVAEYSAGICSDGAPSAPSSTTPTPQAYLWRDKTTDAWRRFPSGMTSAPLTDDRGEALLTWFLEGSRARTSAPPEKAQESPESAADSGKRWRESSVKFDRDSSSWKTHQCLFSEVLPWSSVTLPRWGMMRDGVCWERTTSERHTSGTASGLWQTPVADDAVNRVNGKINSRGEPKLSAQVLRWPTPNQRDWKDTGATQGNRKSPNLGTMVHQSFATPTKADAQGGPGRSDKRTGGDNLRTQIGGSLNPTWVEWLMGWPLGWTDCAASATDKYQQWRRSHGACLEVDDET